MSGAKSVWGVTDHRLRRLRRQALRLAGWRLAATRWPLSERYVAARHGVLEALVYSHAVAIGRSDAWADPTLEAGKKHNLALAAPAFDGVWISPARPLSFWRTLGPATRARGYTWGMELRGGCVTPAVAGGLCLLSNALFEMAARAGWSILERSGHSIEAIPATPGSPTLDATVAFPDVDLVVAPRTGPVRLAVAIHQEVLQIQAFAAAPPRERFDVTVADDVVVRGGERFRRSRVLRRRLGDGGAADTAEEIASGERRILAWPELGRSCLNCGETTCHDRPSEPVLTQLRGSRR